MDVKIICNMLRNPVITLDRYNMAPMDMGVMRNIANLIEQQNKLAELWQLVNQGVAEVMPHTACKGRYQSNHCNYVNAPGDAGCVLKYYCKNQADLMREALGHSKTNAINTDKLVNTAFNLLVNKFNKVI